MDELKLAQISRDAMKFTRDIISTSNEENANTIYDLKRQMLTNAENHKEQLAFMKEQLKRSEDRKKAEVDQLKDQIEGLKRQIR